MQFIQAPKFAPVKLNSAKCGSYHENGRFRRYSAVYRRNLSLRLCNRSDRFGVVLSKFGIALLLSGVLSVRLKMKDHTGRDRTAYRYRLVRTDRSLPSPGRVYWTVYSVVNTVKLNLRDPTPLLDLRCNRRSPETVTSGCLLNVLCWLLVPYLSHRSKIKSATGRFLVHTAKI